MAITAQHPDPLACSSPRAVLIDALAYIGDNPNSSTAENFTSDMKHIQVSICTEYPPAPSRLFVHCPNLGTDVFYENPHIICTADGFLLLRIQICGPAVTYPRDKGDYFIYRPGCPSLQLIPKPPLFHDDQVGLLPRGELFTIAALSLSIEGFTLHLFHSESGVWTVFNKVPVVTVERRFPFKLPRNAVRLNEHMTTTVITLGGKNGTMGWVDLWSGILLCDVLTVSPTLRDVPLPLPQCFVKRGMQIDGCPKPLRGIAVVQGYIKLVELDIYGEMLPMHDPETGHINFRIDDWELIQYTRSSAEVSCEDWKLEHTVKASSIGIDEEMHRQFLKYGLLDETPEGRKLQNLNTCQPALSLDDTGAIYLLTKTKFMQRKAWVLAVNIMGNKIQALSEFGIDRSLGLSVAYCPSMISRYIKSRATPESGA
ncbi:hypothetical protein QOZ80_2BG0197230 [Eleusine coracana subsp. coracana]|nr:hypothetical protein QOZ80_2BG0197230 [Eleusine coracana subsp. coracana]